MYLVVDLIAAFLVVGGIVLAARRSGGSAAAVERAANDPAAYARRIAGTMIAAFGLAIGVMVTLFHFASLG